MEQRAAETRRGWCLPRDVRRRAERLLDQQMWCFGRDVSAGSGNLLLEYGFERDRAPDDRPGSTAYRLRLDDATIVLWGWAVFFGSDDHGGLLLKRFEFNPAWRSEGAPPERVWSRSELPKFARPGRTDDWRRAAKALYALQDWLAHYERWVIERAGLAYREECVSAWFKRAVVTAEEMADTWTRLKNRCW